MKSNINQIAKKSETQRVNHISRKPGKRFTQNQNTPVNQVLQLQRTIGNQAVAGLFKTGAIQAKLTIGKPNDIYEKEADSVAESVMSMTESKQPSAQRQSACPECIEKEGIQTKLLAEQITPLIQRQEAEEEEEPAQTKLLQRQEDEKEEETAQTKAVPGSTPKVTPGIEADINSMKAGGQPLPESTRAFFEPRFGADFSNVRVHNDSHAANTAQSINAKAFTTGKDIAFNSGQYSPTTSSGKKLLAHELTHVVQQNKAPSVKRKTGKK